MHKAKAAGAVCMCVLEPPCEFGSGLRRIGVWLQCVLWWGRRAKGREGQVRQALSEHVYH